MRQTILALAGASSLLFLPSAAMIDLNDGMRALKRADDMKDTTPLTAEEGKRLRSLMERAQTHVFRQGEVESIPEPKVQSNLRSRVLAKAPKAKTGRKITQKAHHPFSTTRKALQTNPRQLQQVDDEFVFDDDVSLTVDDTAVDDTTVEEIAIDDTTVEEMAGDDIVVDDFLVDDGEFIADDLIFQTGAIADDEIVTMVDDQPPFIDETGDDLVFMVDDQPVFVDPEDVEPVTSPEGGELKYVSIYFEGFQDGQVLVEAIPPNPEFPDEFDAGAFYIFDKEPIYGVITDSTSTTSNTTSISVDPTDKFATVTGQCIRTDPNDELDAKYVGRSYCHFVYTAEGLSDEFIAEGPLEIGQPAALTVTGGIGIYRRTVGEVILTAVDTSLFPEVTPSSGDLPASYYMQVYIYMDAALVPAEVLA